MDRQVLIIALILSLILCCSGCQGDSNSIPGPFTSGDYECLTLEDGTVEITKCNAGRDKDDQIKITIPKEIDKKTVARIGKEAFRGCRGVTDITIPDTVNFIGDEAFAGCWQLTSITIPDSVTSIGINPFEYCGKLMSIYCTPDQPMFSTIDDVLFEKSSKKLISYPQGKKTTSYTIPQGIAIIGEKAFDGCNELKSISIPDSVTSIEDWAFDDCSGLTSLSLPEALTDIGFCAFDGCEGLTQITIPGNVTSIGYSAFGNCKGATSLSISDSVTTIGESAFYDCDSLTTVNIPAGVTKLENNVFCYCDNLASISVSPDQSAFEVIDDVLFEKNTKTLICYPIGKSGSSYVVPEGTTAIADMAFCGSKKLESITIPSSVTSIGRISLHMCDYLTAIVERDSYAADYCKSHDVKFTYAATPTEPGSTDWLNN